MGLSLPAEPEIGTRGGISLGGKVLKPGFESRPESLLLPWELGRFVFSGSPSDLSKGLSLLFSFFSRGGMIGLEGDVSLPMALQVWANKASGLFFASSVVGRGWR